MNSHLLKFINNFKNSCCTELCKSLTFGAPYCGYKQTSVGALGWNQRTSSDMQRMIAWEVHG